MFTNGGIIEENEKETYDYTLKSRSVAIVSNGSATLGYGNTGPSAAIPVMEGKSVIFKTFSNLDAFPLCIKENDKDAIVKFCEQIEPTFGAILLEDIKAPECFYIENELKKKLNIPVFHDDQHGTAIITSAALINACDIAKKKLNEINVVINGAGASAMACAKLFINSGVDKNKIKMLDSKGVIYKGRDNLNEWKNEFSIKTDDRNLSDAIKNADVFLGLSQAGVLKKDMVKIMAKNPIIFACANPDPEITPEEIEEVRDDAIIATGRSDYPNQVNNLIGFPYIFRGALDVRAKEINDEMKIAAAKAIATLAREEVPDEVVNAYGGERPHYGKDYIIPSTFDPRLISRIPSAVAEAAIKSGVARKKIVDIEAYKDQLTNRLDPSMTIMQGINAQIKKRPKTVVFAEGEDQSMLKAAVAYKNSKLGIPIVIGNEKRVKEQLKEIGLDENYKIKIVNSTDKDKREIYSKKLYSKLQRKGLLERDVDRLIRNDRIIWGASMVDCGDADAMVTGNIRHYAASIESLNKVVDPRPGEILFGLNMLITPKKTIFIADTQVNDFPSADDLVKISLSSVRVAKLFGFEPKVAFLSHSTFGKPLSRNTKHVRDAIELLKTKKVDFDFDGEMQPDVALNPKYKETYPFSKIVGNANILIMPALHSAAISTKLMKTIGGAKIIGPLLIGLGLPIEIAPLRSSSNDILNLASVAAYSAEIIDYKNKKN